MKNRKNVLIVFAILAILCFSIGYATLTEELTFTGTVDSSSIENVHDQTQFNLVITEGSEGTSSTGVEIKDININTENDTATFTVIGLDVKNEYAVVIFKIKNTVCPDGYKAKVTGSVNTTENTDNKGSLAATATIAGETLATGTTVALNDTIELKVTITATSTLATAADKLAYTVTVKLNGTPVAAS